MEELTRIFPIVVCAFVNRYADVLVSSSPDAVSILLAELLPRGVCLRARSSSGKTRLSTIELVALEWPLSADFVAEVR